jgi:tetratricopeptide (TPR) repeat protein
MERFASGIVMAARLLLLSGAVLMTFAARADDPAPGKNKPPTASDLMARATADVDEGKLDRARTEVIAALALEPNNTAALDLRASIYVEQKLWNLAERDYTRLNQLSPDPAYQYKLAQIKFLQKEYDEARPMFAALKDDPRLGDLARYKVFICDLLGSHQAIAAHDLELLDQTGEKPSYYFGRALWLGSQGQSSAAGHYLARAAGKFSDSICALYKEAYANVRPFHPMVASFTTLDGRKFDGAAVFLEADGLRTSTDSGWVTLPLDQLPDDLSPFPEDLREKIDLRRHGAVESANATPLTFTTRAGKIYRQVRWTAQDAGLAILTPDGWTTIPYSELPDNLSSLPETARRQITDKRADVAAQATHTSTVSFTTQRGKSYESARAWLDDDGVDVLTEHGPVVVPFADLPADLSPFPAAWRTTITERLKLNADASKSAVTVSFTTQEGKAYVNAHAELGGDGVMILSPNGWTTVRFIDLPDDLSPFPENWRSLIRRWLLTNVGDTSGIRVVSFTTRRGKRYDEVRATLDDKGLDVLGPNGWVLVSFDQLPGDLSPFPPAWRQAILAKH